MRQYNDLVNVVLRYGTEKSNRTGVDTLSYFGYHYEHDLAHGFPLLTSKKMFYRGIIEELIWYLRGDSDIGYLKDHGITFWDEWADQDGGLDSAYGRFWRRYPGDDRDVDQVWRIVHELIHNPNSRRMVLTAWDPRNAWGSSLPPCHLLSIFNVQQGRLNCHLTQRSGDIALGIPFNMACYSALTHYLAALTGLKPGIFSHAIVDAHIYTNHIEGLREQVARPTIPLPDLHVKASYQEDVGKLFVPTLDQFELTNYNPHPGISFDVAV